MWIDGKMSGVWISLCAVLTAGCVAQEADLKRTERDLQQRIKQSSDESAQTRARQGHEISALREQELPQLRGDVDRALHQAQELQGKQDDLKQQAKKLEQLAAKIEAESATRYAWAQKNFETQELKSKEDRERFMADVNSRLDDVNRQTETLRKELIEVVQKTGGALMKNVDARLEEQQKAAGTSQIRSEQLAEQFAQFSRSLAEFRDSLTGLNERLSQEEQAGKASMAHLNEMNKSVTGYLSEVNKSLTSVAQKFAARFDEQDQRLDALSRAIDQDAHLRGKKPGAHQPATKPSHQSSVEPFSESPRVEREVAPTEAAPASGAPASSHVSQGVAHQEKLEYERLLTLFRSGDLDGAKEGFAAFLRNHPNSDLSPNARYWLGESYYGKKDYRQAIDSYDRVELDFPKSEKVPAALLKKGYAYLAMKDKKRAASAFKQVVTSYPRSSEAGKAADKLSQLKE
ncbi:MAG: tol-pal system protein YbgF [Nitrospirae bacterium]|nr:tol-pal system protein YbgF [Nitrospirota bacterium]